MSIATASQRSSGYSASQTLIRFIPSPSLMRRGERSDQAQGSSSNAGLAPIGAKKKGKGVRAETQRRRDAGATLALARSAKTPFSSASLRLCANKSLQRRRTGKGQSARRQRHHDFAPFASFFSFLPSPARGSIGSVVPPAQPEHRGAM